MSGADRRMSTRCFLVAGFVVALLVAGFASYYASSHPDGLEYVAEETGFLSSQEESATGDSPFADYQTAGIENARVSGGVAGVLGTTLVLVVGGGLFWLLRRRRSQAPADSP